MNQDPFFFSDAMAYRGDLIGCEIKFSERDQNGAVPVIFTLNSRELVAKKRVLKIQTTGKNKDIYPFIGLGHKGIQVLAKVKHFLTQLSCLCVKLFVC